MPLRCNTIPQHVHWHLIPSWHEFYAWIEIGLLRVWPLTNISFSTSHCGTGCLPSAVSVAHMTCCMVRSLRATLQPHTPLSDTGVVVVFNLRTIRPIVVIFPHQTNICFGCWSNTWRVTDCTIMRKWEWLFRNGCECKSPRAVVTALKFTSSSAVRWRHVWCQVLPFPSVGHINYHDLLNILCCLWRYWMCAVWKLFCAVICQQVSVYT